MKAKQEKHEELCECGCEYSRHHATTLESRLPFGGKCEDCSCTQYTRVGSGDRTLLKNFIKEVPRLRKENEEVNRITGEDLNTRVETRDGEGK